MKTPKGMWPSVRPYLARLGFILLLASGPLIVSCGSEGRTGSQSLPTGAGKPVSVQGDSFNNGGGESEATFAFAWNRLGEILSLSVETSRLAEALKSGALPRLRFISRSRHPDRFSPPRVAVAPPVFTERRRGAPLFIDEDALSGRPFSLREAASALTAGLAFQNRIDLSRARALGARVALAFATGSERLSLSGLGQPELAAWVLTGSRGDTAGLFVTDGASPLSLADGLRKGAPCPERGQPVREWRVSGAHWVTGIKPLELRARVRYLCDGRIVVQGALTVSVPVAKRTGERWSIVREKVHWEYQDLELSPSSP